MTNKEQLEQHFGVSFKPQASLVALRQFHVNNAFYEEKGVILGLCACENEWTSLSIPAFLKNLQYLNLSDNKKLKQLQFDKSMSMPDLEHLDISDAQLLELELPEALQSLRWLDASRNKLQKFEWSGDLPELVHLDLSDNQLKNFPAEWIPRLPKLKRLYLKGNPLPESKRTEAENQANCLPFMQEFYQAIAKEGGIKNDEYKVLLVGNGKVGKTCMVHRLVDDCFKPEWDSTHGIELRQLNDPKKLPYILNLWDFGGQDIYHATHRLFMQSSAIYLALWDMEGLKHEYTEREEGGELRKYENYSLQYWLDYIKNQGGNPP